MSDQTIRILRALFAESADVADLLPDSPPETPDNPHAARTLDEAILDAIHDYAEALAAGEDADKRFPEIHALLQQDAEARLHMEALQELLTTPVEERKTPPHTPAFDLSFLLQTSAQADQSTGSSLPAAARIASTLQAAPTLLIETGRAVVEFSRVAVDALLQQSQPLAAHTKSDAPGRTILQWQTAQPEQNVLLRVTARSTHEPEECDLVVGVDIPSRGGWPNLGDIPVSISYRTSGPTHELQPASGEASSTELRRFTDPFGTVLFSGVPRMVLPTLRVEIDLEG